MKTGLLTSSALLVTAAYTPHRTSISQRPYGAQVLHNSYGFQGSYAVAGRGSATATRPTTHIVSAHPVNDCYDYACISQYKDSLNSTEVRNYYLHRLSRIPSDAHSTYCKLSGEGAYRPSTLVYTALLAANMRKEAKAWARELMENKTEVAELPPAQTPESVLHKKLNLAAQWVEQYQNDQPEQRRLSQEATVLAVVDIASKLTIVSSSKSNAGVDAAYNQTGAFYRAFGEDATYEAVCVLYDALLSTCKGDPDTHGEDERAAADAVTHILQSQVD